MGHQALLNLVGLLSFVSLHDAFVPNPLFAEHTFVVGGSRHPERALRMRENYEEIVKGNNSSNYHLHMIDGINGDDLQLMNDGEEGHLLFQTAGLSVRLWDWREGRGIGGTGMNAQTVARIAACSVSHLLTAAKALHLLRKSKKNQQFSDSMKRSPWPILVLEDDVTFRPLIEQKGGQTAIQDAVVDAENLAASEGSIVGLIQLGYLIPSPRVAVAMKRPPPPDADNGHVPEAPFASVRRRRACTGDDRRVVGIQAYLLTEAGAEALLEAYWRPGGAQGAIDWMTKQRTTPKTSLPRAEIDLRPAVNFAADYMLFNAIEATRSPAVRSYLSWRPWIVEDEVLSAKSSLFPGTVKQATALTLRLAELLLDGREPPHWSHPLDLNQKASLSRKEKAEKETSESAFHRHETNTRTQQSQQRKTSTEFRPKLADFLILGDAGSDSPGIFDISVNASTPQQLLQLLFPPSSAPLAAYEDTIFEAAISQCFKICDMNGDQNYPRALRKNHTLNAPSSYATILVPSAMQCYRATVSIMSINNIGKSSHETGISLPFPTFNLSHFSAAELSACVGAGLDTDRGACIMLTKASRGIESRRIATCNAEGHANSRVECDAADTATGIPAGDPFEGLLHAMNSLSLHKALDAAGNKTRAKAVASLVQAYKLFGDKHTSAALEAALLNDQHIAFNQPFVTEPHDANWQQSTRRTSRLQLAKSLFY